MNLFIMDKKLCNYRWGFYQLRFNNKCIAIGFRIPFTKIDIRFALGSK